MNRQACINHPEPYKQPPWKPTYLPWAYTNPSAYFQAHDLSAPIHNFCPTSHVAQRPIVTALRNTPVTQEQAVSSTELLSTAGFHEPSLLASYTCEN